MLVGPRPPERQHEAHHGAEQQGERGDQNVPARGANGGRQLLSEECAQAGDRVGARPIDGEKSPYRQRFQIKQEVAIEHDGARDRKRGESGAVEDRQPLQLIQ